MKRIVVGVDGSPAAMSALRWAVSEARAHDAAVEAWHAWHVPYEAEGPPPDEIAVERAARARLEAALHAVAGVEPVLVRALPATALLEASRQADLLVVGRSGSRLGALGGHVVAHAHCPVVVVPELAGSA